MCIWLAPAYTKHVIIKVQWCTHAYVHHRSMHHTSRTGPEMVAAYNARLARAQEGLGLSLSDPLDSGYVLR